MKLIKRSEIKIKECQDIFKRESHHNHKIIEDKDGVFRWKKNQKMERYLEHISLNDRALQSGFFN